MHKEYAMAMARYERYKEDIKRKLTDLKLELIGKIIDKDLMHDLWGTGAPVFIDGRKYQVHKMSYGDYFAEPWGYPLRETDPHSPDTYWFKKLDPYYYILSD